MKRPRLAGSAAAGAEILGIKGFPVVSRQHDKDVEPGDGLQRFSVTVAPDGAPLRMSHPPAAASSAATKMNQLPCST